MVQVSVAAQVEMGSSRTGSRHSSIGLKSWGGEGQRLRKEVRA